MCSKFSMLRNTPTITWKVSIYYVICEVKCQPDTAGKMNLLGGSLFNIDNCDALHHCTVQWSWGEAHERIMSYYNSITSEWKYIWYFTETHVSIIWCTVQYNESSDSIKLVVNPPDLALWSARALPCYCRFNSRKAQLSLTILQITQSYPVNYSTGLQEPNRV